MSRALLLVLDSVGIGGAPDAAQFGDAGADTLGHIAAAAPLKLPHLVSLGLARAARAATGAAPHGLSAEAPIIGQWGYAIEQSNGKDTPSGHWEIAGVPVNFDWHFFPRTIPAFPKPLTDSLIARCRLPGILGNKHASGTEIIQELGEEHIATGRPIVYTSADSVMQIAAHEESFGLARLYDVCAVARALTLPLNLGRIIARPFLGRDAQSFARTGNRKDYALAPPRPTLLDRLADAGRPVISLGKIGDIYAHRGTGREVKAVGNMALADRAVRLIDELPDGGLMIANFVDFDMIHGHRRDVLGYARALEAFDARVPEFLAKLKPGDLLIITADHGNDPTWPGSDHTREAVPVLCWGPGLAPTALGRRSSFADIGQTIARHLGLAPLEHGESWL